jgi:hypothetical protein
MDRDAEKADRQDQALQGDTGMIGSESEEPGPGRDTSLTDPDRVAASTDQPQGTVAMSEGDPMRTRLGSHVEDAGPSDRSVFADEPPAPQLSAFAPDDAGSADRTTVAEDPVRDGVYDQEANQAGRERP